MQFAPGEWMRTFNILAENQPDRLRAASQLLSEILEQHAMRQPSHLREQSLTTTGAPGTASRNAPPARR